MISFAACDTAHTAVASVSWRGRIDQASMGTRRSYSSCCGSEVGDGSCLSFGK